MPDSAMGMPSGLEGNPYSPTTGESTGGGGSSGGSGGASGDPTGQPSGQSPASLGMPTNLPGSPYSPFTGHADGYDPSMPGAPETGTPTSQPTGAVPGDGDGDGIPDSERQPGGSGTPGEPTGKTEITALRPPAGWKPEEDTAAEEREAKAEDYAGKIKGIGDAAKTQGADQTAAIGAASDAAKVDYEGLGNAAGDVFIDLENRYKGYADKTAEELNKTTEETLEAGRKYASGAAQEDALRTSNLAVQQAYKAAKTAGMLPGQAALVAAQEVGGAFSDTFTKQLQAYDAEYATANTTRRQEIEAEAQKALEGMQKAQAQQKEITDAKVASAYEGLSQMTQAQQESLNQQLDALMAAQSGEQGWAGLTLQEKIAELQAKAQKDANSKDWLDKIFGGIAGITGLFI